MLSFPPLFFFTGAFFLPPRTLGAFAFLALLLLLRDTAPAELLGGDFFFRFAAAASFASAGFRFFSSWRACCSARAMAFSFSLFFFFAALTRASSSSCFWRSARSRSSSSLRSFSPGTTASMVSGS